jgi:hypothetical protein
MEPLIRSRRGGHHRGQKYREVSALSGTFTWTILDARDRIEDAEPLEGLTLP